MPAVKHRFGLLVLVLSVLMALLLLADIVIGSAELSLDQILRILFLGEGTPLERSIVLEIRLQRAVMAVLAGAALSVSGLQMQTIFQNPLAGPYVLGISSGASLGVAILLLGAPFLPHALSAIGMVAAAWIGAAAVLILIVSISRNIRDIMVILIIGIMLSSAISAFVEILQYLSNESNLKSFVVWSMATVGETTAEDMAVIVPALLLGFILNLMCLKPMNMMLLGTQYAVSMGLNLKLTRNMLFISTTLLAGTVTAFCGPIGFVGLAVPHVARLVGRCSDRKELCYLCLLLGASMLLACDIISKWLSLPINTATSLMGIPVIIYIVTRKNACMV